LNRPPAHNVFYFPGDGFGFGLGFARRTDPGEAKPPRPGLARPQMCNCTAYLRVITWFGASDVRATDSESHRWAFLSAA
jgi:hypothetical protein